VGSTITLTGGRLAVQWFSGSTSIATVSSTGVVTGIGAGVTTIYYNSGGCYAYHSVTVTATAAISGGSVLCTDLQPH